MLLEFIRAPHIEEILDTKTVTPLAKVVEAVPQRKLTSGTSATSGDVIQKNVVEKIVAARNKNILVTCFHPELSDSDAVHKWFLEEMVEKGKVGC